MNTALDREGASESVAGQPRVKKWRWWIHFIVIGSYPILISAPRLFRHIPNRPAFTSSVAGLLVVSGAGLLLFSILFGVGWFASRASREEMLLRWRPGWWVVPLGIGYSIAVRFAVGGVIVLISGILLATHLFTPPELQESLRVNRPNVEVLVDVSAMQNNSAYFWLIVTFNSFVVAGLREEMWRAGTLAAMRALWPDTFGGRDGGIAAVALIAILFGAAHFSMGILAAGIAGLLGLLLGIIMVAHKSIWPAVIAHGLFDATTFALLPWASEHLRQLN